MRLFAVLSLLAAIAIYGAGCQSASYKVMSYNIRHGEGIDHKVNLERIADVIKGEDARFVALQEVDVGWDRSGNVDQPAELERLTGMYGVFAKAIHLEGRGRRGDYGVMVLSREEPTSIRKCSLPGREQRVLLMCEFVDVVIATTHLDVRDEQSRKESVEIIRREIAGFGKPVIITGDWNAKPDSEVVGKLKEFITILSPTNMPTWHGFPEKTTCDKWKCIDYIAIDRRDAVDVVGSGVIANRVASDHAPVFVEIACKEDK